jgi:hypothetical protein
MTDGRSLLPALPKRGQRYDSLRFEDARGNPMPAYVVGEFVIEKTRRDWDGRSTGPGGRGFSPGPREWWEVRRQHSRGKPGASFGRLLFDGRTLRECLRWIGEQA